ncbi:hypothetical protein JCM8097_003936 [Rhodosporidiobolus ruineniae]
MDCTEPFHFDENALDYGCDEDDWQPLLPTAAPAPVQYSSTSTPSGVQQLTTNALARSIKLDTVADGEENRAREFGDLIGEPEHEGEAGQAMDVDSDEQPSSAEEGEVVEHRVDEQEQLHDYPSSDGSTAEPPSSDAADPSTELALRISAARSRKKTGRKTGDGSKRTENRAPWADDKKKKRVPGRFDRYNQEVAYNRPPSSGMRGWDDEFDAIPPRPPRQLQQTCPARIETNGAAPEGQPSPNFQLPWSSSLFPHGQEIKPEPTSPTFRSAFAPGGTLEAPYLPSPSATPRITPRPGFVEPVGVPTGPQRRARRIGPSPPVGFIANNRRVSGPAMQDLDSPFVEPYPPSGPRRSSQDSLRPGPGGRSVSGPLGGGGGAGSHRPSPYTRPPLPSQDEVAARRGVRHARSVSTPFFPQPTPSLSGSPPLSYHSGPSSAPNPSYFQQQQPFFDAQHGESSFPPIPMGPPSHHGHHHPHLSSSFHPAHSPPSHFPSGPQSFPPQHPQPQQQQQPQPGLPFALDPSFATMAMQVGLTVLNNSMQQMQMRQYLAATMQQQQQQQQGGAGSFGGSAQTTGQQQPQGRPRETMARPMRNSGGGGGGGRKRQQQRQGGQAQQQQQQNGCDAAGGFF